MIGPTTEHLSEKVKAGVDSQWTIELRWTITESMNSAHNTGKTDKVYSITNPVTGEVRKVKLSSGEAASWFFQNGRWFVGRYF